VHTVINRGIRGFNCLVRIKFANVNASAARPEGQARFRAGVFFSLLILGEGFFMSAAKYGRYDCYNFDRLGISSYGLGSITNSFDAGS
jgi:hypothetical protein